MVGHVSRGLPTAGEKPRYVAAMFGRIARRYDLMNTLMTFGQDAYWRRVVAERLLSLQSSVLSPLILDVGTGTGRLGRAVLAALPGSRVLGMDFTLPMLRIAANALPVAAADALRLPIADEQFDAVISGFLVRNLAGVASGLREQIRVLRPGGLLVIMETTPGPGGALDPAYRLYFRRIVPVLGGLIADDASAYTYLPESTLAFIEPARLVELLRELGLHGVTVRRLAFGSVAVTSGVKPG